MLHRSRPLQRLIPALPDYQVCAKADVAHQHGRQKDEGDVIAGRNEARRNRGDPPQHTHDDLRAPAQHAPSSHMRDAQHHFDRRHECMRLKGAAVYRWKGEDEDAGANRHPDHPQRSAAIRLRLELHTPAGNHNGEYDRDEHSDWPCQCPARRKKARPPYRDEIRHPPKQKVPTPVFGALASLAHHRLNQSDALADLPLIHRTSTYCVSIRIHRRLLLSFHSNVTAVTASPKWRDLLFPSSTITPLPPPSCSSSHARHHPCTGNAFTVALIASGFVIMSECPMPGRIVTGMSRRSAPKTWPNFSGRKSSSAPPTKTSIGLGTARMSAL